MKDVIVIGSGPAGLSAAINVVQRGGEATVISLPLSNNPLFKAEKINNYLGLYDVTGKEMLETFFEHAQKMGVTFVKERVLNTMNLGSSWMVSAGADVYEAKAIVFAGGIVRGKKFEGEEEFLGRGVSYCATCDGMLYRGKDVTVIGFGDADKEEAEYLTGIGCNVTYVQKPKQVKIEGSAKVERVICDGTARETACVFVLRPSLAPTSLFPGLELDGGYIKTDRDMATNLPGLFAAGDCIGAPLQVAKAVGDGMIAGQKAMAYVKELK